MTGWVGARFAGIAERREESAATDKRKDPAGTEGEAKTDRPIGDRAHAQVGHHLGDHCADVLHPAEADLEHRETGLHEHDETGGDDHPYRVGGDAGCLCRRGIVGGQGRHRNKSREQREA
jgi:hypothetical protein